MNQFLEISNTVGDYTINIWARARRIPMIKTTYQLLFLSRSTT